MQMLNFGGILMIAFAAWVSFFRVKKLIHTGLSKSTLILIAVFYASRALEEIVLAPRFSPIIFAVCLLVAIIYLTALIGAKGKSAAG
jgi:hypothetical protein